MSPDTERLVRESWASLQPVTDATVASFYKHLFETREDLAALFRGTNMDEQRRKFAGMLSEIVRALDRPSELVGEVAESGRRHARYGVHESDYAPVGDALFRTLGEALGEQWTPEVSAAWREVYQLVAGVMRRGVSHPSATSARL